MGKVVLKAPVDWTGTITTSEGDVELKDGIAEKYTKKVADHLVQKVPGWKLAVIEDEPKAAPEKPAEDTGVPGDVAPAEIEDDAPDEEEKSKPVDLPVLQDYAKTIRKFAKDHDIPLPKSIRSKKDMLSVIYEHYGQS